MKWIDNMTSAIERGENGVCPYCGSSDTEHGFTVINKITRAGYGSVWCNACKKGMHLSRMIVPDGAREQEAPRGIEYN
ncbi:MAG: hypothetical protein Q4F79_05605 [Eubacteriales bacterium]|nr:hypothetical protein [Eubacteriales bacterium]